MQFHFTGYGTHTSQFVLNQCFFKHKNEAETPTGSPALRTRSTLLLPGTKSFKVYAVASDRLFLAYGL